MKLKSTPEDFRVDEQTEIQISNGPFALYRLTKRGLGTPEAINEILLCWGLPRHRISYGGLKDRHAQTTQHVTIHKGPQSGLSDRSYTLEYLGQVARPFAASDISSNLFEIRLRGIEKERVEELERRVENSKHHGILNYFDDQRFGSIGHCGELIGVPWCKGDYERALYLALAEPNSHDRPREREQKGILRDYWGQWEKCKSMLDRSHRRSVVTYLVDHPVGFKRAVALIRQDLRGIYVAAFQSWVWNRWLSALIESSEGTRPRRWLPSRCGPLALPSLEGATNPPPWGQLAKLALPLPSARQHEWPEGTLSVLDKVLESLSMTVREMRLKYPRDTFFSRGDRLVILRPKQIDSKWERSADNSDRNDWLLRFELPRGAYATMVLRQWTLEDVEWDSEINQDPSDAEAMHPDENIVESESIEEKGEKDV